jgi:pyruvate/2-oxoglutarate dehydrogenase complex dihydrolipoamide dehydrogenase (E3) component
VILLFHHHCCFSAPPLPHNNNVIERHTAIIHSANMAHSVRGDIQRLEAAGIYIDPKAVKVDFERVMERVRKVRAEISHHDSAERYSAELGVEVYIGRAKFASERSVTVNGRTLHFKRCVIATGGYPTLIPMAGLKELHDKSTSVKPTDEPRPIVMTNETFFNMTKQPKNMVVIGPGVIGMELAQAMQRLGTNVTVVGRSGTVLPKEDEDMAEIVKRQLIADGVAFRLDVSEYKGLELTGRVLDNGYPEMKLTVTEKWTPKTLLCDALLVAAGRRPNVTGLDLEVAKVEYCTKRGLIVNDRLQTTNPRVYGVGDCCSEFKFTHAADFMARTVIRNAMFFGKGRMSDLLIPYATFTSPEIASVGLYGKDLDEKGIEYRVFEKHFKDNDRSICDDARDGFVRFRVDAKKDTILGCSIVGEGAGNMIGEVALAMETGTGLGALASIIHPYPTRSEAIRQSGDVYNKTKLTTTVKMLLRGIVKIQS